MSQGEDAGGQHLAPMGFSAVREWTASLCQVGGSWGGPAAAWGGKENARAPSNLCLDLPAKAQAAISVKVSVSPQQRARK